MCGHGGSVASLGPVEGPLSLSSSAFSFRGFEEVRGLRRPGTLGSPLLAQESLVFEAVLSVEQVPDVPQPGALPGGGEQDVLRITLLDEGTTRVDFLAFNYRLMYKREVPAYLLSYLRPSSYRQYESVWRKFKTFARSLQPHPIDRQLVMDFLIHVFENKRFQVRTLMCYRSALV